MATMGDYKLKGLKTSRLYYMRNPPKFIHITVLVIIMIIAGALIWSTTAVKAEEVENSGIVVDSGVKSISNDVAGTIIEVDAREGDFVSKGDILFIMDSSVQEAERRNYENTLKHYDNRLSLITEFMDTVENDRPNPFINLGDEREFYEMMKSYENELEQASNADQKESVRMKYLNNAYTQKINLEKDINNGEMYQALYDLDNKKAIYIGRLLDSVGGGSPSGNPFKDYGDDLEWHNLYDTMYNNWYKAGEVQPVDSRAYYQTSIIRDFYNTWLNQKLSIERNLEQYIPYITQGNASGERLAYVEEMIDSMNRGNESNPFKQNSTDPLEIEYYDLFNQYLEEANQSNLENKHEAVKLKYLSAIRTESNNASDQIVQLKAQIASSEANIAKYTIRAAETGVVHYDTEVEVGSYIQTGTAVGSLNSGSDKQLELAVSAHDRARMAVGQECRFTVDGLLQTEFGCIKGRIYSIANDATVTKDGSFFKVKVAFEDQALVDDKGNMIEIINGMSVKTWTVYERNTYMQYFLDNLGF